MARRLPCPLLHLPLFPDDQGDQGSATEAYSATAGGRDLSGGRNRLPVPQAAGLAFILLYLAFVAVTALPNGNLASDSHVLVRGTRIALDCVHEGTYTSCANPPGSSYTDVGPYAPLQYAPAVLLVKAGFGDQDAVEMLARLSFVAFVALLVLLAVGARRLPWRGWTPFLVVAVASTPMLYQSTSSFGESLAATAVLACVVAALWRRPVLLGLAVFAAGTSKETMFVFLAVLVLVAARREEDTWPPARLLVPTAIGLVGALVVNAGLNVFRFGSPRNLTYLLPVMRTPLPRRIELFGGLWVAPNVGLLFYATVATVLFVVVSCRGCRLLWARPREPRRWGPPLGVGLTVVLFTVGLASWVAPFGWDTYGSRLFMPLLPAAVLVAVHSAEPYLRGLLRRLTGSVRARVATSVAVAVVGLPQFASPWTWSHAINALKAPSPHCTSPSFADPPAYYRCTSHTIWRLDVVVLRATVTGDGWQPKVGMALLAMASSSFVMGMGRSLAGDGSRTRVDRAGTPADGLREPERAKGRW